MDKIFLILITVVFGCMQSSAQSKVEKPDGASVLNPDHAITTEHTVTVKGVKIPYKAIAGTIPVYPISIHTEEVPGPPLKEIIRGLLVLSFISERS